VGGACSGAGGGVAAGSDEWSPGPGMEGAREARLRQVASLRASLRPGPSRRRVSHVRGRRRPQELAALKRGMDVVMAGLGGLGASGQLQAEAAGGPRSRARAPTRPRPDAAPPAGAIASDERSPGPAGLGSPAPGGSATPFRPQQSASPHSAPAPRASAPLGCAARAPRRAGVAPPRARPADVPLCRRGSRAALHRASSARAIDFDGAGEGGGRAAPPRDPTCDLQLFEPFGTALASPQHGRAAAPPRVLGPGDWAPSAAAGAGAGTRRVEHAWVPTNPCSPGAAALA
jgi:hypothetical protein